QTFGSRSRGNHAIEPIRLNGVLANRMRALELFDGDVIEVNEGMDFTRWTCPAGGKPGRSFNPPGPLRFARLQPALGLRARRALSSGGANQRFPFPFPWGSIGRETGKGSLSW